MITVIESDAFIKQAEKLLTPEEWGDLIVTVAANPEAGDIIPKTGGVRKLRFARKGQGKSGSYRVIYYYYNENNPAHLFSVYAKSNKDNISDAGKNELYKIVQAIKKDMKE